MPVQVVQPNAGAALYAFNNKWLVRYSEDIIEPDLPIVDPHHHLWEAPEARYLLDELLEDIYSGHNITATVYLQCRSMYRADGPEELQPVGETEFVNGVAAMCAAGTYGPARICAGIVGHADLLLGGRVEKVLEAHIRAGGDRFRGIRHSTAMDPDPRMKSPAAKPPHDLMMSAGFRDGFSRLAKYGLTFDSWLYHTQIPQVIDLARKFPGTTIILNHVGGMLGVGPYEGRRDELFPGWKKNIAELATCPNVAMKVGGLGMRNLGLAFDQRPTPPSSVELAQAWKPYVETCISAFGVDRCMFESNFPVDKVSCSYPVLWNAFKRLTSGCSAGEKAALFSGTATRVYRL